MPYNNFWVDWWPRDHGRSAHWISDWRSSIPSWIHTHERRKENHEELSWRRV